MMISKFNKKAAMFGLDARIALAIFGALSVISGAALYSAIQQAKIVALVTDLTEVGKAIEAYMLDTGEDVSLTSSTMNFKDLLEKPAGVTGWNGPYISPNGVLAGTNPAHYINHNEYGNILIRYLNSDLGGTNSTNCSTVPCFYWIQLNSMPESLVSSIDKFVDGSNSPTTGNARIIDSSKDGIFIKGPLMLKQP